MSILNELEKYLVERDHNFIVYSIDDNDKLSELVKVDSHELNRWMYDDARDNVTNYPNIIVRRDDDSWKRYKDASDDTGMVGDLVDGEKQEGKQGYMQADTGNVKDDAGSDFTSKFKL